MVPPGLSSPGSAEREHLLVDAAGMRAWWFFVVDRDVRYPRVALTAEVEPLAPRRHLVRLRADGLIRDLSLFVDRLVPSAEVDRQLVTALAGEVIELEVTGLPDVDVDLLCRRPVCRTANDLGR